MKKHLLFIALPLIGLTLLSCDNLRSGNTDVSTSDSLETDSITLVDSVVTAVQKENIRVFQLDEIGIFKDREFAPLIYMSDGEPVYFVAAISKPVNDEIKYVYAYSGKTAFIKIDGEIQALEILGLIRHEEDEESDEVHHVTILSQNDDYYVEFFQNFQDQHEGLPIGHITVTRRADKTEFKSDLYVHEIMVH